MKASVRSRKRGFAVLSSIVFNTPPQAWEPRSGNKHLYLLSPKERETTIKEEKAGRDIRFPVNAWCVCYFTRFWMSFRVENRRRKQSGWRVSPKQSSVCDKEGDLTRPFVCLVCSIATKIIAPHLLREPHTIWRRLSKSFWLISYPAFPFKFQWYFIPWYKPTGIFWSLVYGANSSWSILLLWFLGLSALCPVLSYQYPFLSSKASYPWSSDLWTRHKHGLWCAYVHRPVVLTFSCLNSSAGAQLQDPKSKLPFDFTYFLFILR